MRKGLCEEVPGLAFPDFKGKFFVDRTFEKFDYIPLDYIPTEDNVADIFTKPTTKAKLEKFKHFIMGK